MMKTLLTIGLFCLVFLAGCTLPRREADTALFAAASPVGFSPTVRYYSADWRSLDARLSERLQRVWWWPDVTSRRSALPAGADPSGVSMVYLISAFPGPERECADAVCRQVRGL